MNWSLIPLAVTVLAAIWAVKTGDESPGMYGGAIFNLMVWMAALIVTLIAWLVWAVLA